MNNKISNSETMEEVENLINIGKKIKKVTSVFGLSDNEDFDKIGREFSKLKAIPDDFNELFSQKGWIAHDTLDINIAQRAIERGEDGESLLIDYYESKLEFFLSSLPYKPIFKERSELLHLVYEDYINERYHSCIPVVLMLVDGIVNDVKNTGLFADNTDLDVWDSITGHSTGLKSIVSILKKSRKKTNVEAIKLPYRNGILHGRDLNYNNKTVAIKTFAILFYINDWIISLESETRRKEIYLAENERNIGTSFLEMLQLRKDYEIKYNEMVNLLDEWTPRKFIEDFQTYDIDEESPEEISLEFLEYIKNKNYGSPISFYSESIFGKVSVTEKAGIFRENYSSIVIDEYKVSRIEDISSAITHVYISVNYTFEKISRRKEIDFRMIYEVDGDIENRLKEGGKWKIVNIEGLIMQFKN